MHAYFVKSCILTVPSESVTTGIIAGSGLKLCIFWYSVWLCHVDALIILTPL